MRTITGQQALDALRQAVAQRGEDYVYLRPDGLCLYQKDGAPSCGVGLALNLLGVSVDDLAELDNWNAAILVVSIETIAGLALTLEAKEILQVFQHRQDSACTWGHALREAEVRAHKIL